MSEKKLSDACVFCKIIKGEEPKFLIAETELSIAILDINPLSEGHTLVMPKYHANKLEEVPDEYLVDLLPLSKRIAPPPSVSFRHVPHFHFHVIPKRDAQDGIRFRVEDFERRVPERDEQELAKVRDKMREALAK
ncbi:hypothetical protein HWV62_41531 [Athelia sp. TMB]|nr:hypothetical protein HWV62_41531 [Athelia sp. TMB]